MSVTCWVGCHWLLIYMVRSFFQYCPSILKIYLDYRNILYRWYRFLSPFNCLKLANSVPYLTNVRHESGCSEEWTIIGITTIRCISEQLWIITCNKNCCEAFIQIRWVLFPIAMNRPSGYNPIYCPTISAKLWCFEIPRQVEKVACRACAWIPDVTIPCFDLPNFQSELASAELFGLLS